MAYALITGASKGIGLAIANELARRKVRSAAGCPLRIGCWSRLPASWRRNMA